MEANESAVSRSALTRTCNTCNIIYSPYLRLPVVTELLIGTAIGLNDGCVQSTVQSVLGITGDFKAGTKDWVKGFGAQPGKVIGCALLR